MRTNFIVDAFDATFAVLEAGATLPTLVDDKFYKRAVGFEEFAPGKAPFLSGWPTIPEQVWWAMGPVQLIQLQIDFWACVCANDREDFSEISQIYVEILGDLTDDLCDKTASILRTQGRVHKFQITNPQLFYGQTVDTDEGIYVLNVGVRLDVQNPNV